MPYEETKPATAAEAEAEGEGNDIFFHYTGAFTKKIGRIFGSRIAELIQNHATCLDETAKVPTFETTDSIRTKIPSRSEGDGIIWLDVGFANVVASVMFPNSHQLAALSPEATYTTGHTLEVADSLGRPAYATSKWTGRRLGSILLTRLLQMQMTNLIRCLKVQTSALSSPCSLPVFWLQSSRVN